MKNADYLPFNTFSSVHLALSCEDCGINSLAGSFTGAWLDVPEMFREKGITYTASGSTSGSGPAIDVLTITFNGFSLLPPGFYDIGVQPGVLTGTTYQIGGARIRIVYGTTPVVYNAMTSPLTASVQRITSNLTDAIFVTNATKIGIAQIVLDSAAATVVANPYSTYYDKLYPISAGNGAEDVSTLLEDYTTVTGTAKNSIAGTPAASSGLLSYVNYTYNMRLSEGTYRLNRKTATPTRFSDGTNNDVMRNIVIIVDRTAPGGRNATWTGTAQSVGGVGKVALPTTMFWDAVSNVSSQITVMSTRFIGSDGLGFYCPTPVPLNAAFCYATKVRGPSGTVLVEVVAADEAGNQAVGFFTIPVVPALVPTLTVADKRGVFVSDAFKTGGPLSLTTSTTITFKAVVTFADPVNAATLTLDVTTPVGVSASGNGLGSGVSSANGRVVTFTVVVTDSGAGFSRAALNTQTITFQVAALAATRSADSIKNVAASNSVIATIDNAAPTFAGNHYSPFLASVGTPFFAYIPLGTFADTASAAKNLQVTLGTTADVVGLTVTVGKLGRAYISGTAASLPTARIADGAGGRVNCNSAAVTAKSWIVFSLTVQDEAGNSLSDTFCVEVNALAAGESTSLLLSRNTLTYAEGATAAALDQFAAWSYIMSAGVTGSAFKIYAYLESPDANTGGTEALAITAPTGTAVTGGAMTKDASQLGTLELASSTQPATNDIAQANAIAALRSITYSNTIAKLTPGFRTARIVIVKMINFNDAGTAGDYTDDTWQEVVIGSSFKTIYVTNVNSAPSLLNVAASSLTNIAWTEGTHDAVNDGISLTKAAADFFALTDADDTDMASATLTLTTTKDPAGTPTWGACDIVRDSLYLPSAYLPVPLVYGQWNPTACTFTLKPITGTSMLIADLRAALHAVVYRNSDLYDPANGIVDETDQLSRRQIKIVVTDAAAAGKAAAASVSAAVTGFIIPDLTDDEPYIVWDGIYAPGGLAYSTNQTSNIYVYKPGRFSGTPSFQTGSAVEYAVRKFVLDYTAGTAASLRIDIDFRKVADRIFAGGAIRDFDSANGVASGDNVKLSLTQTDLTTAVAGADLLVSTDMNEGSPASSYSTSAMSYFTVTRPVGSSLNGQVAIIVQYGSDNTKSPRFVIWLDVRQRLCINSYAALGGGYRTVATQAIYDPNTCLATPANIADYFTIDVAAAITGPTDKPFGQFVVSPVDVATGASGSASTQYIGRAASATFNFATRNTSIFTTRHALIRSGATGDDAIRFLANERFANRGLASFYFEKNSFSTTSGVFTLRYQPVGFATALTLPPLAAGEILDANLMFELTPACMQFAFPVTVCIYVGDTPAGYTRSLKMASQKSCVDNTRGWMPWEPAAGVTFDAMTGLLCGNSSHFTVFATTLVPLTSVASVSKAISMGGSCPNECSGRGFCRSNGVCQCFPGNNGNDCSLRTCPVAESWDAGVNNGHELAECSERGACNAKTGQCACYPGFTGAACQRTACPNDCSGRGQCKLIKDLPAVQGAGYNKWEASRLTKCVCDAGYQGIDCSERVCPFGDDPETTCTTKRQVQQVTFDFGSFPASVANPASFGLFDTDEFALLFRTPFGQNLSVSRVTDSFDVATGSANFARALKALPGFAVSDVSVTGAISADKAKATYNVTFDGTSLAVALSGSVSARLTATANTVPGNQALFICPTNRNGALGCMAAGCRPKFAQTRVLDQPASGITASKTALLWQPEPATGVSTVGKWAVTVVVTVQYKAETGAQSYSVTSSLWENTAGATVDETPVPPAGTRLRNSVKLVYGLEVDFDSGVILDGTYVFRWRLPSCTVTEVVPADKDLELAECSRRGVCDRAAGTCKCFPGYAGASCGMQTVVV